MKPDGGHFGEGDGVAFTTLRLYTTFFGAGFLTTGFLVALAVILAVGLGVGAVVAAKAVLVEAIIAAATIIESTRPFIRDSI